MVVGLEAPEALIPASCSVLYIWSEQSNNASSELRPMDLIMTYADISTTPSLPK